MTLWKFRARLRKNKINMKKENKESPLYKPCIYEVIGKSTKCLYKWCSRKFKAEDMHGPHASGFCLNFLEFND